MVVKLGTLILEASVFQQSPRFLLLQLGLTDRHELQAGVLHQLCEAAVALLATVDILLPGIGLETLSDWFGLSGFYLLASKARRTLFHQRASCSPFSWKVPGRVSPVSPGPGLGAAHSLNKSELKLEVRERR